jgi:hypothetical protein
MFFFLFFFLKKRLSLTKKNNQHYCQVKHSITYMHVILLIIISLFFNTTYKHKKINIYNKRKRKRKRRGLYIQDTMNDYEASRDDEQEPRG